MKTKNPTNKELLRRIENLEERLNEVANDASWGKLLRPIGPKFRDIPISPEFPDFGKITVIDTEPNKSLKDRTKEG